MDVTFESPVQNLDALDIVGVRKDGGLDLVVVVSGPLDGSADTLRRIDEKIRNYIDVAASEQLWIKYPDARPGPVRIIVRCEHSIDSTALGLIRRLGRNASARGASLAVEPSSV